MSVNDPLQHYWNSNTRLNKPVKILGSNGENYAIEADGHVYVVPKINISTREKFIETFAPKPKEQYWFTLTSKEWAWMDINRTRLFYSGNTWNLAIEEILIRNHTGIYTNEWFCLSDRITNEILALYHYDDYKYKKDIEQKLPMNPFQRTVVRQLWAKRLHRDGIHP